MKPTEDDLGGPGGLGRVRVKEGDKVVIDDILDERTAVADERDADNNGEEGEPSVEGSAERVKDVVVEEGTELIKPKVAMEE